MARTNKTKPKGTGLTQHDKVILCLDGEPIWRSKENLDGSLWLERDENGVPIEDQILHQEKLTRRKAINLALVAEPKDETADSEAKLRAGYLQRMFYKDAKVELDSGDVEFLKKRINHRFHVTVYCYMCEYLEGTETKK